ncbi:MAG TPA: hypothetical protein VK536_03310 [Candidatus Limnocylindrales bacterium]|nr:hypothetical protein [Candidatus Limnocylindrales bacterium]
MPSDRFTLETMVDQQKAKEVVLQALDNRGYRVEEEFDSKIVAKHPLSTAYYPHKVEVLLDPKSGKTVISASIDHRASRIYLKRLSEELAKLLPPLPARVFNPIEKPTSQQELEYQAKMLNRSFNTSEQVIWSHTARKGVFNKEITERWFITNMRAIKQYPVTKDNQQEKFLALGWLDLSDSVVMNQFRNSKGNRIGSFAGVYGGGGFAGAATGISSGKSMSFGDIVFLHNDREIFRFQGISDPDEVNRLIITLKKEYIEQQTR